MNGIERLVFSRSTAAGTGGHRSSGQKREQSASRVLTLWDQEPTGIAADGFLAAAMAMVEMALPQAASE